MLVFLIDIIVILFCRERNELLTKSHTYLLSLTTLLNITQ